MRIDKYLQIQFPGLTRRQIEEAIAGGLVVFPSGKKISKGERAFKAEDLNLDLLHAHLLKLTHGNTSLIIYQLEDHADFCVVDKPAGTPSHPISLLDFDTISHWALAKYPEIAKEFSECQPTVTPHRLDTGTSGVLVVAKTKNSFLKWREHFSAREITKKYLAWCWGNPKEVSFVVKNHLAHDNADARKMRGGKEGDKGVRPPFLAAHSTMRVERRLKNKFLMSIECSTGVTHQVRVHCAELGFPLVGDSLYDPEFSDRLDKPAWHELRAVAVIGPAFSFKAPDADFCKKYQD